MQERTLLTSRVINTLPGIRSLWDYGVGVYGAAKNSHSIVKAGFDLAERTAQPFVQKYKEVDSFADSQLDQVKGLIPTTHSLVKAAAYPIGYAYSMALGGMNALESTVEGTRLEGVVEKVYDIADSVVDGVMPPQYEATGEHDSEPVLHQKNPIQRIGRRMSLKALRAAPRNTVKYALSTTTRYSKAALINSVDYSVALLWDRVDSSLHNLERIAHLLMRFDFTRNLLKQSVPQYLELTDRYELSKRLRQESSHFAQEALNTLLTCLDTVHSLVLNSFPRTSEIIETVSVNLFNLQLFLEYSGNKKRALPYDESEEESLSKRQSKQSTAGKREENAWHKVTTHTHRSRQQHPTTTQPLHPRFLAQPVKPVPLENPYSALSKISTQEEEGLLSPIQEEVKEKVIEAATQKKEIKEDTGIQEESSRTEEEKKEEEKWHEKHLKIRAKQEMERWAQQEREEKEEQKRKEHEQKLAEERALHEHKQREEEEERARKEKARRKEMKRRQKEKAQQEHKEQEAKDKAEEEAFEKQLAHYKASQAYKAEHAAHEAELAQQRKREAIERNVAAAIAKREKEERKANAPRLRADENARQLIEEAEREEEAKHEKIEEGLAEASLQSEAVEEKGREKKQVPKQKAEKKHPEKAHNKLTEKVLSEVRAEKKEVSVIGGTTIVDDRTDWVEHSDADGPWQTVTPSHATHKRADDVINPPAIQDADHHTVDLQSNPYFPLEQKIQPEEAGVQLAPTAAGGAGI